MRTRTLRSWETRRWLVEITAEADPTLDTVEFAAVDVETAGGDPAGWTAGSWSGSYDATTKKVIAETPTFGTSESPSTPDVELTEGTTYRVLCRVRNATDAPGDLVAVVRVS